jgi:P-loop Domain of unknown function (DUF2791)
MESRLLIHPQLGRGKLLKTYMNGHEFEVMFESGKRFRLPAREFEPDAVLRPPVIPLPPRQVHLESDQFRARQTLEALRFGIVPVQDVQTLTIGLEAEGVSLNRAIDRSRERGGDVLAVIGDYGFGKSHFIELAAQRALRENFIVMSASLDLVEVPPAKPREIYRSLAASTRYPDSNQHGLRHLLRKTQESPRVLSELMNIAPLGAACPLIQALNALSACGSQAAYEDIVLWISGQITPTSELRSCLKKPTTLYKAGEVARQYGYLLTGWSTLANLLGYSGLAVLIDESEHYSLLKARHRERADSFFKSMIYATMGGEHVIESSIPQHYLMNYPVSFVTSPNLFFLFALTESENRLPVDEWLAPSQIVRLDDRFIEKDIYSFMNTLVDYHALAYGYAPNGSHREVVENAPKMLARTLAQHRINLRELIRTGVTLFDLLFLYDVYSPNEILKELAHGLGL